jgi:hypothetical protein
MKRALKEIDGKIYQIPLEIRTLFRIVRSFGLLPVGYRFELVGILCVRDE